MRKIFACWVVCWVAFCGRADVPTRINYQGRLLSGTNLVNGTIGMSLRLCDAPIGGSVLYEDSNTVTVSDGLYSTFIGDQTTAGSLTAALMQTQVWVEVTVNGVALSPREQLGAVASSLTTRGLLVDASTNVVLLPEVNAAGPSSFGHATVSGGERNRIGALSENSVIAGGYFNVILTGASYTVIGGGIDNTIAGDADLSTIAGGMGNRIGSNSLGAVVAGGLDNRIESSALYGTVAGGIGHSVGTNASYAAIGGGSSNRIASGARGAVVAGGVSNRIGTSSTHAVIGGGEECSIGSASYHAVISGGYRNFVSNDCVRSVVIGGEENRIGSQSQYCSILGGQLNRIVYNTWYTTIAGGHENTIGEFCDGSFIAGGYRNGISNNAQFVFVGGRVAKALHSGTFVWGDNSTNEVASTAENQVTFRCQGGVRFLNTNGTLYAAWVPGAANWSIVSDQAMKEKITPVDTKAVLEKVAALPISEWNYAGYPQRHIGPMAQDFHAAFPFNENDRAIDSGDLPGVALAAIQALKAENDGMRKENAELRAALMDLVERVRLIEAR